VVHKLSEGLIGGETRVKAVEGILGVQRGKFSKDFRTILERLIGRFFWYAITLCFIREKVEPGRRFKLPTC
jgi:hypothetical protein